jgi:hypothetical protein
MNYPQRHRDYPDNDYDSLATAHAFVLQDAAFGAFFTPKSPALALPALLSILAGATASGVPHWVVVVGKYRFPKCKYIVLSVRIKGELA